MSTITPFNPDEVQSILLEDLGIRWEGTHIQRLALNQHMPRVEKFSEHEHDCYQVLLYLRGSGIQHFGKETVSVKRGSLLTIPHGLKHRFVKSGTIRPVCVAIDLHFDSAPDWKRHAELRSRELSQVEGWLVRLHESHSEIGQVSIESASLILQILDFFHQSSTNGKTPQARGELGNKIEKWITHCKPTDWTPGVFAETTDWSLDHINRLLREEGSPNIGRIINDYRLRKCQKDLQNTGLTIGEIASAIGHDDQNYFSRWFRKQTGQTPTRWREAMRSV